jgi:GTP cyclohydrolase I
MHQHLQQVRHKIKSQGFARKPNWFVRHLIDQVQERLTGQVLLALQTLLETNDVAVSITADTLLRKGSRCDGCKQSDDNNVAGWAF